MNKINNKNGNNTRNHEIYLCPLLHIRFNIHVQNNIYTSFNIIMRIVLGTLQLKLPTQYFEVFPEFWIKIIIQAKTLTTK